MSATNSPTSERRSPSPSRSPINETSFLDEFSDETDSDVEEVDVGYLNRRLKVKGATEQKKHQGLVLSLFTFCFVVGEMNEDTVGGRNRTFLFFF